MNKPQRKGEERIVYQGKILEIVEQDMAVGEKVITFETARRSPGVRLIIVTSENKLRVSKEYRNEVKGFDYRLPGGKVIDSLEDYNKALASGADISKEAENAGRREAEEEASIKPTEMSLFSVSHAGTTVNWDLYYFVVTKYEELDKQSLEDGEIIETVDLSFDEVKDMCLNGEFKEDRSVAQLLKFIYKRN